MTTTAALRKLLGHYIGRTRRAEEAGDDERAEKYRRRRDQLSKLTGLRQKQSSTAANKAWRDAEIDRPRRRPYED